MGGRIRAIIRMEPAALRRVPVSIQGYSLLTLSHMLEKKTIKTLRSPLPGPGMVPYPLLVKTFDLYEPLCDHDHSQPAAFSSDSVTPAFQLSCCFQAFEPLLFPTKLGLHLQDT